MKRTHRLIPALAIALVLLGNSSAHALVGHVFEQHYDDTPIRWELQKRPEVEATQREFGKFIQDTIWPLKETEIEAICGHSIKKLPTDGALPLFSYNGVKVSGLRHEEPHLNKDHTEYYRVADLGYLQVIYQIDGVSVAGAVFYFKTDENFTPLKKTDDFEKRLAWDKSRLEQIRAWMKSKSPTKDK